MGNNNNKDQDIDEAQKEDSNVEEINASKDESGKEIVKELDNSRPPAKSDSQPSQGSEHMELLNKLFVQEDVVDGPIDHVKRDEIILKEEIGNSEELIQELSNDRKLVVAKTDNIYEVFICDGCSKQVKSPNIYLCQTCDFNFGLCEMCLLKNLQKKEKAHNHNLICVPNTFYKPYNIFLHQDIKFTGDERTVHLIACHPLTSELEIQKEEDSFKVYFTNKLYFDRIVSQSISIYSLLDLIPIVLKNSTKSTLIIKRDQ